MIPRGARRPAYLQELRALRRIFARSRASVFSAAQEQALHRQERLPARPTASSMRMPPVRPRRVRTVTAITRGMTPARDAAFLSTTRSKLSSGAPPQAHTTDPAAPPIRSALRVQELRVWWVRARSLRVRQALKSRRSRLFRPQPA